MTLRILPRILVWPGDDAPVELAAALGMRNSERANLRWLASIDDEIEARMFLDGDPPWLRAPCFGREVRTGFHRSGRVVGGVG